MLNRILLPVLMLFAPAIAQDAPDAVIPETADPALAMPPATVAYAEFDADALQRGVNSLDVVRTVFGDEFATFFKKLREQIPEEQLRTVKPVKDWIRGRVAVGLSGLGLRMRRFDGSYDRVRIAPDERIDPRLVHLLIRAAVTHEGGASQPSVLWDPEGVAIVEPGESMRTWLEGFLADPPVPFEHKFVQRGARQILTLKFEPFVEDDFWFAPELHVDLTGDRWVVATSAELLQAATEPATSLAADDGFRAARARYTSGERVAFAYLDAARLFAMAKPFLAPVLDDAMALNGLAAIRHLAIGYSIVDGGVRESYGIGLAPDAGGFWKLLDAFPPGLRSIAKVPPSAVGLVALKLDAKRLDARFAEVCGALFPGAEAIARTAVVREALRVGINVETEVLPAFGDERAVAFFPSTGFIPEMLVGADLRDEEAFRLLMSKIGAALGRGTWQLGESEEGWKLSGVVRAEFRIHDGHLVGSTSGAVLRRTLAGWAEPEATMGRDAAVFRRVMKGLNGGDTESLVALVYADIPAWLPHWMNLAVMTRAFEDGPFELDPMPDFRKLASNFSGIAIGLRRDEHGIALESFGPLGPTTTIPLLLIR